MRIRVCPALPRLAFLVVALSVLFGCGKSADDDVADLTGVWTGAVRWQGDAEDQLTLDWPAEGEGEPSWYFSGGAVSGIARAESRRPGAVAIRLEERQPCVGDWRLSGILVQDDVLEATLTGSDCTRSDEGPVTLTRGATDD